MTGHYKGVPEGASAIIPRLYCRDVEAEAAFCCEALGAEESLRRPGPDGRAQHALLRFGPAMLMIEAENKEVPTRPPKPDGSSPVVLYLYVEDVDAAVARALGFGSKLVMPVETHFWGDRIGWVQDPEGHMWTIASRVEETTEDQRSKRWSNILDKDANTTQ
ncbi:MAG: VOC family protein [Sphingomicrobium sp.]